MERLIELRKKNNKTQSDIARELSISRQAYSNYELGNREADYDTLNKLADYFGVSVDYLLGRIDDKIHDDKDDLTKYGLSPVKTKKFRMLGEIACGEPIFCNEEYETFVEASADINADFCLTAKGDSMINARIFDGDIVFIKSTPEVNNGEIAAVVIDDEATLKRVYYYRNENKLVLSAENPRYAPLVYVNEELDSINILGKAVAFMSYVK